MHCPALCSTEIKAWTRVVQRRPFRVCDRVVFPDKGKYSRMARKEIVQLCVIDSDADADADDEYEDMNVCEEGELPHSDAGQHDNRIAQAQDNVEVHTIHEADDIDLQAWNADDSWTASLEVIDEDDSDADETCVRVSEVQSAELPKDACMSDSGAGGGVDPYLQNFERIQPSKTTLLAANGSKMDNRGKGLRRRMATTIEGRVVAVYDEAYHCPDAPKPIASEGQHAKQGGSVIRAGHMAKRIEITDIHDNVTRLDVGGVAQTWWLYPDGTVIPLVKGRNNIIDYMVPVQPTPYAEATTILGRQEVAHKYAQSKVVSAMDITTQVQEQWLNMDYDVTVEKYQKEMQEIQRKMEQCCYMQHKLRGMADEDTTELAHVVHEQVVEWGKRVRDFRQTDPAMPKQRAHGIDPHLVPLACAKCEQDDPPHSAYTCTQKCAECRQHQHTSSCSKVHTKGEYIHKITNVMLTAFECMPDETLSVQRESPMMDKVDVTMMSEAYDMLEIAQAAEEESLTRAKGKEAQRTLTGDENDSKREMVMACGWQTVMQHAHEIADVLDMQSKQWLNMLTEEERMTLAVHAIVLRDTEKKIKGMAKHDDISMYTPQEKGQIRSNMNARTQYKKAVAQARAIVEDAMAAMYDDSVTGRSGIEA